MSKKTTAINGGCPQVQLLIIYDNKKMPKIRCFTTAFYLANNGDITPRYPAVLFNKFAPRLLIYRHPVSDIKAIIESRSIKFSPPLRFRCFTYL